MSSIRSVLPLWTYTYALCQDISTVRSGRGHGISYTLFAGLMSSIVLWASFTLCTEGLEAFGHTIESQACSTFTTSWSILQILA